MAGGRRPLSHRLGKLQGSWLVVAEQRGQSLWHVHVGSGAHEQCSGVLACWFGFSASSFVFEGSFELVVGLWAHGFRCLGVTVGAGLKRA